MADQIKLHPALYPKSYVDLVQAYLVNSYNSVPSAHTFSVEKNKLCVEDLGQHGDTAYISNPDGTFYVSVAGFQSLLKKACVQAVNAAPAEYNASDLLDLRRFITDDGRAEWLKSIKHRENYVGNYADMVDGEYRSRGGWIDATDTARVSTHWAELGYRLVILMRTQTRDGASCAVEVPYLQQIVKIAFSEEIKSSAIIGAIEADKQLLEMYSSSAPVFNRDIEREDVQRDIVEFDVADLRTAVKKQLTRSYPTMGISVEPLDPQDATVGYSWSMKITVTAATQQQAQDLIDAGFKPATQQIEIHPAYGEMRDIVSHCVHKWWDNHTHAGHHNEDGKLGIVIAEGLMTLIDTNITPLGVEYGQSVLDVRTNILKAEDLDAAFAYAAVFAEALAHEAYGVRLWEVERHGGVDLACSIKAGYEQLMTAARAKRDDDGEANDERFALPA